MTDVLLSYARNDRGVAARLAACLAERGLKAVWDVSELPDGALVSSAQARLHRAPAIVALWSEASAKSIWVREEAQAAAQRDILVSALIDGTQAPVQGARDIVDLSGWTQSGAEPGLDALITAIAGAASRAQIQAAPQPERAANPSAPAALAAPQAAPENAPINASIPGPVNGDPPPGETAATAIFIIIAFLTLLGVAMVRQAERTPAPLPLVSMDADAPLDVPVLIPTPDEENAPSGLRPVPDAQESTGSVRK